MSKVCWCKRFDEYHVCHGEDDDGSGEDGDDDAGGAIEIVKS